MAAEYQVRVPLVTLASTGFFPHLAGVFRMSIFVCLLLSLGLAQATPRKKKATASAIRMSVPVEIPSATGKPNILFIIVDDLNDWVRWLGGHPHARRPNMDRLAKMGARFTNVHTAYALLKPAPER
jgi:hypothetical protein